MPARKREVPLTPEPSGRRRSSRISLSGTTSKYFEGDDSDEDDVNAHRGKRAKMSASAKSRNSARRAVDDSGDSDADAYEEEEEEEEEEDGGNDEEETEEAEQQEQRSNKKGGKKSKRADDSDDDDTPRVTFVPHKKLRDLGGVDYADDKVHPVTMHFLRDLKANNRREWLKANDAEFRRAQKDWLTYVETLGHRLAVDADDTLPELPAKDVVFRIYRDIRFSKDPRPYKAHFSAAWSRTGKKGPYACYYVHCEPGSCFVGGGLWHPDNDSLRLLRASIDERPQRWRRVLAEDPVLKETFLSQGKAAAKDKKSAKAKKAKGDDDEAAAKKAFARINAENALKKKPLGYSADHRDIELLKLRNFTMHKKIPDSVLTDADGQDSVMATLKALVPFVTHLNRIVRPDPGDDSDSDEGDVEGEGDEGDEEEEEDEE